LKPSKNQKFLIFTAILWPNDLVYVFYHWESFQNVPESILDDDDGLLAQVVVVEHNALLFCVDDAPSLLKHALGLQ
jgi:hypothetical protein